MNTGGETIPNEETEDVSHLNQNACEVIPGQKLPAEVLDTVLRTQDKRTISLGEIIEQCQDGVIACVHTKRSKKRFQEEFSRLEGAAMYPHIHLTYIGISGYPPSVNTTLSAYAEEDGPEFILSDPGGQLLGPMGYIHPTPTSKAWKTRFRQEGPVRRGFFIIKKDTTLFVRRTGTLEGVLEAIARAKAKFHKEWTDQRKRLGLPMMPW